MRRIGEVLASVFDENGMEGADEYMAVISSWADITAKNGLPAASAHSWIKSVDKGIVWLEVDHPGWKQILQAKESKFLHDFRYRFPQMGISALSIMLCRPGTRPDSTEPIFAAENQPPPYLAAKPSPAPEASAEDPLYSGIKSRALRERLARLGNSVSGGLGEGA